MATEYRPIKTTRAIASLPCRFRNGENRCAQDDCPINSDNQLQFLGFLARWGAPPAILATFGPSIRLLIFLSQRFSTIPSHPARRRAQSM